MADWVQLPQGPGCLIYVKSRSPVEFKGVTNDVHTGIKKSGRARCIFERVFIGL